MSSSFQHLLSRVGVRHYSPTTINFIGFKSLKKRNRSEISEVKKTNNTMILINDKIRSRNSHMNNGHILFDFFF